MVSKQLTHNQQVGGSSPSGTTNKISSLKYKNLSASGGTGIHEGLN